MKKVGIIVGHHGPKTGCTWEDRDEWRLAFDDAIEIYKQILVDGLVMPLLYFINRDDFKPEYRRIITNVSSLKAKAAWVNDYSPDCCFELHYNSADNELAEGNEVLAYSYHQYAENMDKALALLPNKHRICKERKDLYMLRQIQDVPMVIVEPAFIWEPCIGASDWRPMLAAVIKHGVYKTLGIEETYHA